MNTPVNLKLDRLLFDNNGFQTDKLYYPTPTIAEVVMWLYERYEIWIYVIRDGGWWIPVIQDLSNEKEEGVINIDMNNVDVCFNSQIEAYEAAITYTLIIV